MVTSGWGDGEKNLNIFWITLILQVDWHEEFRWNILGIAIAVQMARLGVSAPTAVWRLS